VTGSTEIYLSIVSDDFGMCPEVNEGIIQGFEQGLLTDTNLMAPCPAFPEAARWAAGRELPVGIHVTFTSEWDHLRWKPLTDLKSMRQSDGTCHVTVEEAWEKSIPSEADSEFEAQWGAIESRGLKITFIGEHMGNDSGGKLAGLLKRVVPKKKTPYVNTFLNVAGLQIPHYRFNSYLSTSGTSTDLRTTKDKLKSWIQSLAPGHHLWTVHCAMDRPGLAQICSLDHPSVHWARAYRAIDQTLVLDPEVRDWIQKCGIALAPTSQCPIAVF